MDREPNSSHEHNSRGEVTGSLRRLYENYLRSLRLDGCTEATLIHKKKQLKTFLDWLECQGHSLTLADLTGFDIQGHLEDMIDRGLSVNTRHTRLRSIRAWCNWMVIWNLIAKEESPVKNIKPPRLPKEGKPFMSPAEFQALLDLCPLNTFLGARRQAMLWTLATTGMRRAELWSLQVPDLDWDGGIIHIRKGKGQKERWVPFMPEAQRPMLRYLHQRGDVAGCLWLSEEGRPIKSDQIGLDLKRLMQRAEVEVQDVCHVFRRTWAANAERQKIPRPYIQAIAGWSTPTMLDKYVKAMQQGEEAIEAFRGYRPF